MELTALTRFMNTYSVIINSKFEKYLKKSRFLAP